MEVWSVDTSLDVCEHYPGTCGHSMSRLNTHNKPDQLTVDGPLYLNIVISNNVISAPQ